MGSLSMSELVAAPVDVVFAAASDLPNAAEHISGIDRIELLSDGPVGVGTRWRETRTMMGRAATETLEITRFDPPHSYTAECDSCGSHFASTFRFEPEAGATRVTIDMSWRATSLAAKLMSPLAGLMMGQAKKCVAGDLADIKRVAENRAAESQVSHQG